MNCCFLADYKPCDPEVVKDRMNHLDAAYEELLQLAADRRARLHESRKLWQFYWDMADEEGWIKEKEQLMASPDLGHDLTSVHLLLKKHKVRSPSIHDFSRVRLAVMRGLFCVMSRPMRMSYRLATLT